MASSSFSSRMGSLPAKFALPLFLSFPLGGKGEEYNSAPPRRGPAQASVARAPIAANNPEPHDFERAVFARFHINFIRPIPMILNPERTKKFRPRAKSRLPGLSFLCVLCVKALTAFMQILNTERTENAENTSKTIA